MEIIKATPAQRRREAQRDRIIAEAVRLFQENGGERGGGFEATTIESIAERADISVRSFFRYFDSKADVIYLDITRSLEDLHRAVLARLEIDLPLHAVLNGALDTFNAFTNNPVNRARLALALTSSNWADRRAVWMMQRRKIATDILMSFCDKTAANYQRAQMGASLALSPTDVAASTWARYPKSDLQDLARAETVRVLKLLNIYELEQPSRERSGKPRPQTPRRAQGTS
ncbi:TetR family transcriptional regulator [Bradyrhizobium sp. 61]|uniref:TetR/AcrR family transcriptional regulator n=1 Tax=unclassified Bradyrhizobium TaxID=2631580 RepID=UPI001FF7C236|nr:MULTISPECIES: TetR/AcrR family transcriptional regulator [unclassified Bradyrhizobium]MCK1277439.1 TetR family transcriptional regulator [Bradyrhizobium sp. 61]MCK1441889.1 TetR family transcriptional regulator [Bradyrhizobium sp. 48]MCK1465636.1 TetR family transcriptional regulator [Bradyrhizobium sp. 2]